MKTLSGSLLVFIAGCLVAQPAWGDQGVEERLRQLEEQLQRQEEKLAGIGNHQPNNPGALNAYWKEGFRLETIDKAFQLKIGGRVQNDWAVATEDSDIKSAIGSIENGTEFRRARLYLAGHIYEQVEFKFQYDFAAGDADFKDVYLGIKDLPLVGAVRVGQFKEPFSLEELTSSNYVTFMERALPNAFSPSRSTGFMIHDHAENDRMTWAFGAFRDSDSFGNRTGDGEFNFTGRLTGLPWYKEGGRYLAHLGVGYSYRNPNDGELRLRERPEVHQAPRLVDTGTFATDTMQLVGVEGALVWGAVSLQAEYIHAAADTPGSNPDFAGFYVFASYFLTGENRRYKLSSGAFDKIKPSRNFSHGGAGGPGAWEVAARYSHLDLNDAAISGGRLDDLTMGLNWYLNPNTRVMANYVFADLNGIGKAHLGEMRFQLFF